MSRRVAWGLYDGSLLMRIARPGFDAALETEQANLAFDLSWVDLTQIMTSGLATPSGDWVDHGFGRFKLLATFTSLGFLPHVICCRLRHSPQQFYGMVSMIADGAIYVGYNKAAAYNVVNRDSVYGDMMNVSWRYIVTKIPIDS